MAAETYGYAWPAQHSAWAKSFERFCRIVLKVYCPLSVYGRENLPEAPYLIASNHQSHLDSVILMTGVNLAFQKVGLIAAKDYFFDQSHRFYLHYMMNLVPIARGIGAKSIKDSIVACKSFLDSGGLALIIYPEGTRSNTGEIAKFKEGAAILAYELALPLVPAYVKGSRDSLKKGSYFLQAKKLAVSFGQPLKVADYLAYDEKEDRKALFIAYREATLELERRVRALAGQV